MRHGLSFWSRLTLMIVLLTASAAPALAQDPESESKKESAKDEKKKKKDLSLEPTRKVEFQTDEGTWLSLDAAPDGKSLVFEMLGDLYTLPIEGGSATRITEGMAYDSQPRFSPDGKWVAFVSDRDGADNVWIAQADGSEPRKLSKEKSSSMISPAWKRSSSGAPTLSASRLPSSCRRKTAP